MPHRQARLTLCIALWSATVLFVAPPARAHHSYATFDDIRVLTLAGTVKTFQWNNPHVILRVLVKTDPRGGSQEWRIESSSPAILTRFGWRRDSLKPGDHVSLSCNPLRDGAPGGRLHTLTLLDTGQKLTTKLSAPTDLGRR